MSRLAVHVIVEHGGDGVPFGCAYIRDLLPLGHPANAQRIALTASTDLQAADVVVVERTLLPGATVLEAEALVRRVRRNGSRLAYTLDDNLLDAPQIPLPTRTVARFLCREADVVLVATETLAGRVRHLARRVVVLPNALDERLFFAGAAAAAPPAREEVRIGFMGTWTHERDLMLLVQPLREVLRTHPGTRLEVVGGADPALLAAFEGLAVRQVTVPAAEVEYPAFVRWLRRHAQWDVAVAPLEDTPFTRAKSDIKFLDYGALGIAAVCSEVPAYAGTVRHGENGLLVPNDPAAWAEALRQLVTQPDLRQGLADNARRYVAAERTLARRAPAWADALAALF